MTITDKGHTLNLADVQWSSTEGMDGETFNYKDGAKTIVLDDVSGSDLVDNGPPIRPKKPWLLGRIFTKN